MSDPGLQRGRRPATSDEAAQSERKAARIEQIVMLRREPGKWTRAVQAKLAEEWGIPRKSMEELAAEAGRVVAREVTNREEVTADIGVRLRSIVATGKDKDATAAAREWGNIAGIVAAQHHVHHAGEPVLLSAEWRMLYSAVLVALDPFPEARAAVVSAIESLDGPRE